MPLPAFVLPVGLGGLALGGLYWYLHRPHAGVGPAPDNVPPAPPPKTIPAAPQYATTTPTEAPLTPAEIQQVADIAAQDVAQAAEQAQFAIEGPGGTEDVAAQAAQAVSQALSQSFSPADSGWIPMEPSSPLATFADYVPDLSDYTPSVPDLSDYVPSVPDLSDLGDLFSGQRDAALSHDPTVRRFLARKRKRRNI